MKHLLKVLSLADKQEAWSKVFATDRAYREMDNETVSAINLFAGIKRSISEGNEKNKILNQVDIT